jgi:hypothetical protein
MARAVLLRWWRSGPTASLDRPLAFRGWEGGKEIDHRSRRIRALRFGRFRVTGGCLYSERDSICKGGHISHIRLPCVAGFTTCTLTSPRDSVQLL